MKVGLGIVTYNRPTYAEKCIKSVAKHLGDVVDEVVVCDDGSDAKYHGAYRRAFKPLQRGRWDKTVFWMMAPGNAGVAANKNAALNTLLFAGCDWLFLIEDDIIVKSAEAITGYIAAAESTNFHHLSFAHHGPANNNCTVATDGAVSFYANAVGAFTCFTRECLEDVGVFDENLHNAWEHVEHELRLIRAGYMPGAGAHRFPDATGSQDWLAEIPGSLDNSSIRVRSDWSTNICNGLRYWHDNKPETFDMLFGEGMPLATYAKGVLGDV